MRKTLYYLLTLLLLVTLCVKPDNAVADEGNTNRPELTVDSYVKIDDTFGEYMALVDESIYYSLSQVDDSTLVKIYGDIDTPMFQKAKKWINPCMAVATTWNEAGRSWEGISLTTVMDFCPDTYINSIDWINIARNLEQVDSAWYLSNTRASFNTNEKGYAYRMPTALCQHPQGGSRVTNSMEYLGVGPYQHTSSNWDIWDLDTRVNPVWGYEASVEKVGYAWTMCGIDPISDLTVYACLSLGHQGGNLINLDFGKSLIKYINRVDVQDAFYKVGYQMYTDLLEKAQTQNVSLSDLDTGYYLDILEDELGVAFHRYHRNGYGSTNKGDYVAKHCLSYVFYKYYFTSGI